MTMWWKIGISVICVLTLLEVSSATVNVSSSSDNNELLHRMKRFLIYNNGGIVKVLQFSNFSISPIGISGN